MKNLLSLNKYLYRYKGTLLLGIVFIIFSNIFRVFQPQEIRKALNLIIYDVEHSNLNNELLSQKLMHFGLIILFYALVMGIFMYFMRQTIIVMSRKIEFDLRNDIYNHYLSLDTAFFKNNKTGDLMSRITEDVNKVRMYLGPVLLYGINLIILFIIVIATMLKVNFWLSIYTLAPLPLLSYIIYFVSNKINNSSARIQGQLSKLTNISQEAFSGIRVLKSTGLNNSYTSFFNRESQNQKEYALQLAQLDAMFFPSMFFMIGLSALITIYIGGLSTFNGEVTAGNIVEFIIYTNMLTWPVSAIGWCASMIQQAEASQKRINEFLNTERQYKPGVKHIANKIEAIEFKNVSFQYPNAQRKILDNISFIIKENQKIAFVGLTGSGKTTIIDLLLKNIVATEGLIYINGISINDIDTTDLRDMFAYAPQNTFLFSDTIEENLRLSKPNATNQELYLACKKAQFDEEIARIPGGYSAVLGERGVSLSGGQKQRLALARAFLKPSKILILDDSLSALDSYTEDKILKQLMSENNQTLLIVTHRLEQIRDFDLIYVILDGKIVSSGSYTSLSNTNFYFQQLLKHNLYNLN